MHIVDANVLLYAVNTDAPSHQAAREWLDDSLTGNEAVGFAWIVLLAFLRLSTNPAIFPNPLTVARAAEVVEGWLDQPAATTIQPTPRHLALLRGLLDSAGTGANLVNDAHLAALAGEHGATIASFDRDFLRFPGVRLRVPGDPR
ncbi:MAG: TA system VapC family ribonuclease toxin [Acidimicrobiales bacterium]